MATANEEEQLARDLLESLDDLYDQLIGVPQLTRLLTAASIALRGSSLEPVVAGAEPVKACETTCHADLMSAWGVGSLIQATVGSCGGWGRRCRNLAGLVA